MKIKILGNTLSLFLMISFVLCISWGLIAPSNFHMHGAWEQLLPGFTWISPTSFLIGLVGSYLYGWYIAVVFVPLYNYFNKTNQEIVAN